MDYTLDKGILIEECLSYTAQDSSCSPTCSDRYNLDNYETVTGREAIKKRLEKGPISFCLDWEGAIQFDEDGIGRCDGRKPEEGHCAVLVGYSDEGQYWVFKSSWGSLWMNGGYGKLGYEECGIRNNIGIGRVRK